MTNHRLPIFESISAVIAVGLVSAFIALPTSSQRANMDQDVHDRLGLMRTGIFQFSMEHNSLGGSQFPSADEFDAQLSGRSRSDGTTFESGTGREDRWYGPYLKAIPHNPFNNLNTVFILEEDQEPKPTGGFGWIYKPSTGEFWVDIPGADGRGVRYADY